MAAERCLTEWAAAGFLALPSRAASAGRTRPRTIPTATAAGTSRVFRWRIGDLTHPCPFTGQHREWAKIPPSARPFAPPDLQFGHAHDLENDGDRPADQEQSVERGNRPHQPVALAGDRVAVAERSVVLERELERAGLFGFDPGPGVVAGP